MARPKTDRTKITLRMPPELHAQLNAAKADSRRSLNEEIVYRLRQSLNGYRKL
jgi:predicted HicB family RNase H-like nuclease